MTKILGLILVLSLLLSSPSSAIIFFDVDGDFIRLGGGGGGAEIVDTFDRTDADALGTSSQGTWSWTEDAWDIDIVSNAASFQTVDEVAWARAEIDLSSANHYMQHSVTTLEIPGSGGTCVGGVVRYSASARTGYVGWACVAPGGGVTLYIYEAVDGTLTERASQAISSLGSLPKTFRLEVNGSHLVTVTFGGESLSYDDTASPITSNLRVGLNGYIRTGETAGDIVVNNFEAGPL